MAGFALDNLDYFVGMRHGLTFGNSNDAERILNPDGYFLIDRTMTILAELLSGNALIVSGTLIRFTQTIERMLVTTHSYRVVERAEFNSSKNSVGEVWSVLNSIALDYPSIGHMIFVSSHSILPGITDAAYGGKVFSDKTREIGFGQALVAGRSGNRLHVVNGKWKSATEANVPPRSDFPEYEIGVYHLNDCQS